MVILNDKEVSRMMAEKAMHDQAFRDQLGCGDDMKTKAITRAIESFRVQLADQADLRAPYQYLLRPRDLNRYLRKKTNARTLLRKSKTPKDEESSAEKSEGRDREWGWVVSHLVRLAVPSVSHMT